MNSSVSLLVLGQRCKPFSSIGTVGALLGMSKATAYRHAEREEWPLMGGNGTHTRVNVTALCDRVGLPYEVVSGDGSALADPESARVA